MKVCEPILQQIFSISIISTVYNANWHSKLKRRHFTIVTKFSVWLLTYKQLWQTYDIAIINITITTEFVMWLSAGYVNSMFYELLVAPLGFTLVGNCGKKILLN